MKTSDTATARRGILWMLATMFLFVAMDAVVKHLVASYPVAQVAWARFFFHALMITMWLGPRLRPTATTDRPALHILRSTLLLTTTFLFFSALTFLPLAENSAIMQIGPLVVTALSMPLLGEKVGIRRWSGVVAGFAGAIMIIRPGTDAMHPASLLAVAAACTYALYQITTRILSRSESTMTTFLYTPLTGALVLSVALPWIWQQPAAADWPLLVLAGFLGGAGHFALIKAFTAAPAATVAPFGYSALVWATLFGYLLFGDLPDLWTVAGALVIVGSGLYILHREHARKQDA